MKTTIAIIIVMATLVTSAFAAESSTAAGPQVMLETSKGNIVIELNQQKAPATVKSFLEYVQSGYFDGTIFHRVIPGFMIQGGGFTADMQRKPGNAPVKNEADNGLKNDRGTLAMARTQDPHSASSQFFINTVNNDFLNHKSKTASGWGYAVFGKVVKGMDVVDAISAVKTTRSGGFKDVPAEPVVIKRAVLSKN